MGEPGSEAAADRTQAMPALDRPEEDVRGLLRAVYGALAEKGYEPLRQIVGYLLSGDPAFITAHRGARSLVRRLGREELLEELVRDFVTRQGRSR